MASPISAGNGDMVCASCHGGLPDHLVATETNLTTQPATVCLTCHDREHSPRWDSGRDLAAVSAACRAAAR